MIEDIEIEFASEHFNLTEDAEDVVSTNAEDRSFFPVNEKFVMAMVGAGIMLSVLLCNVIALVMRVNMKRRLDKKKKGLEKRKASIIPSGCEGFEQEPRCGLHRPIDIDRLYVGNRSVNYPPKYQESLLGSAPYSDQNL